MFLDNIQLTQRETQIGAIKKLKIKFTTRCIKAN